GRLLRGAGAADRGAPVRRGRVHGRVADLHDVGPPGAGGGGGGAPASARRHRGRRVRGVPAPAPPSAPRARGRRGVGHAVPPGRRGGHGRGDGRRAGAGGRPRLPGLAVRPRGAVAAAAGQRVQAVRVRGGGGGGLHDDARAGRLAVAGRAGRGAYLGAAQL